MSISAGGSTGCGGTGWPKTSEVSGDAVSNIISGNGIVVYTHVADSYVWVASQENADLGCISLPATYGNTMLGIGFDGRNFWAIAKNSGDDIPYIFKIKNLEAQRGSNLTMMDVQYWKVSISAANIGDGSRLIFDGSDFYYAGNNGSGDSGIFRFPKPLLR